MTTRFLANFNEQKVKFLNDPSFSFLKELIEECKCYLMVMAWLQQLTSLNLDIEENRETFITG